MRSLAWPSQIKFQVSIALLSVIEIKIYSLPSWLIIIERERERESVRVYVRLHVHALSFTSTFIHSFSVSALHIHNLESYIRRALGMV